MLGSEMWDMEYDLRPGLVQFTIAGVEMKAVSCKYFRIYTKSKQGEIGMPHLPKRKALSYSDVYPRSI